MTFVQQESPDRRPTGRAASYDRRLRLTRQPIRKPPGGSAVDRLEALVRGFTDELAGELTRVQNRVEASEARTSKDIHDLMEEFRRESRHLNDRMERFHEAAQSGIQLVRDELRDHEKSALEGAARGAAEGASKAAGDVAVDVAKVAANASAQAAIAKTFLRSWQGWLLALSSGFTAVIVALGNVPDFVRGWNSFWGWLGGPHG